MVNRKIKITVVLAALTGVMAIGAYIFSAYQASAREDKSRPVVAVNRLMNDLRKYHKDTGKFPETFAQVQDMVWKLPRAPAFSEGGRSFTMRNYYYSLGHIDDHKVTLWAVPIGPRYKEGSTLFMVLTLDEQTYWKGPALELSQTATLTPNPNEKQLASLLMVYQPSARKRDGKSLF